MTTVFRHIIFNNNKKKGQRKERDKNTNHTVDMFYNTEDGSSLNTQYYYYAINRRDERDRRELRTGQMIQTPNPCSLVCDYFDFYKKSKRKNILPRNNRNSCMSQEIHIFPFTVYF